MNKNETIKKGWYKHFKGGIYKVLGSAKHTETLEEFVLYIHKCKENPDGYWIRPKQMFLGDKTLENGTKVKRFTFIGTNRPKDD